MFVSLPESLKYENRIYIKRENGNITPYKSLKEAENSLPKSNGPLDNVEI